MQGCFAILQPRRWRQATATAASESQLTSSCAAVVEQSSDKWVQEADCGVMVQCSGGGCSAGSNLGPSADYCNLHDHPVEEGRIMPEISCPCLRKSNLGLLHHPSHTNLGRPLTTSSQTRVLNANGNATCPPNTAAKNKSRSFSRLRRPLWTTGTLESDEILQSFCRPDLRMSGYVSLPLGRNRRLRTQLCDVIQCRSHRIGARPDQTRPGCMPLSARSPSPFTISFLLSSLYIPTVFSFRFQPCIFRLTKILLWHR